MKTLQCGDLAQSVAHAAARTSVASLASGSCGLTDNSSPGDWRLPTKDEFEAAWFPCKAGIECRNVDSVGIFTDIPELTSRLFNTSTVQALQFSQAGQTRVVVDLQGSFIDADRSTAVGLNWAVRGQG